jgi:hypothetical protein
MASTTFTAYLPLRGVSGAYTTSLSASAAKLDWRPAPLEPIGFVDGKPVMLNPNWGRHFRTIGAQKLGGRNFPSLPDVASYVTANQVTDLITASQDQQNAANAQALKAVIEILEANGLTAAGSTPPVVLARQEVNQTPPPFEAGGGAGGD